MCVFFFPALSCLFSSLPPSWLSVIPYGPGSCPPNMTHLSHGSSCHHIHCPPTFIRSSSPYRCQFRVFTGGHVCTKETLPRTFISRTSMPTKTQRAEIVVVIDYSMTLYPSASSDDGYLRNTCLTRAHLFGTTSYHFPNSDFNSPQLSCQPVCPSGYLYDSDSRTRVCILSGTNKCPVINNAKIPSGLCTAVRCGDCGLGWNTNTELRIPAWTMFDSFDVSAVTNIPGFAGQIAAPAFSLDIVFKHQARSLRYYFLLVLIPLPSGVFLICLNILSR